jgi:hypothetical protein
MADDPRHPHSVKNEQKSVLVEQHSRTNGPELFDLVPGSTPLSERDQRIGNRALFIQCMADPVRRRIAFNVVERNCRDAFGQGEEGLDLFVKLAADVRRAQVDEAVIEFESRFAPMLDQRIAKQKLQQRR